MSKFGWCLDGHHDQCPATAARNNDIRESTGGLVLCSCLCHESGEAA